MYKKDELEEIKKQLLPETVNLHSLPTKSVEYNNDPCNIEDAWGLKQITREVQSWEFVLEDVANGMEVTVRITKTVFPEPVQ